MSDVPCTRQCSESESMRKRRRVEEFRTPITKPSSTPEPPRKDIKKYIKSERHITRTKLWVWTKKSLFFAALHEFGKDFDKIHNYFNTKIKKLYGNIETDHVVKKEQIKDFYANTLRKASSLIDMKRLHHLILDDSSIEDHRVKEYRELILLSCWWQVMKHEKKLKYSTDKLRCKINEIIFTGTTILRIKKQNVYLQQLLPRCLSQKSKDKVPPEFTVDVLPHNNWSWSIVQNIAQNPRIRLKVSSKKSVSEIVRLLLSKWSKATEQCSEPLTLYLRSPSPDRYQINLSDNRRNSSPAQSECKKRSSVSNITETQCKPNEAETQCKPNEAETQCKPNEAETQCKPNRAKTQCKPNRAKTQCKLNRAETQCKPNEAEMPNNSIDSEYIEYSSSDNQPLSSTDTNTVHHSVDRIVTRDRVCTDFKSQALEFSNGLFGRKMNHRKESEEELIEKKRLVELCLWSIDTPQLLTIGHIYAEYCDKERKEFYIEYEWRAKEGMVSSTQNCLALRRLFNLASTEFQKLSRQSRYQDLFMALNVDKWNTPIPNYRNCETQTLDELAVKIKTVNVAVQAGKDRLILPQPTKLGGFLVPSPPPIIPKKIPSFTLPKRRTAKRKLHRAILPKINATNCAIQLVVPKDVTSDAIASPCLSNSPNDQPSSTPQYYGQDNYFHDWESNEQFFNEFVPLVDDDTREDVQRGEHDDTIEDVQRGEHDKMMTFLHRDDSLL